MISLRHHREDYIARVDIKLTERPSTPDTVQGVLSTDFESDDSPRSQGEMYRAGEASPSAVCQQRRLSAAIVTTEDVEHEFVSGRMKIPVEKLPPQVTKKGRSVSDVSAMLSFPAINSSTRKHRRIASESSLFPSSPGSITESLRLDAWEDPDATSYSIRGSSYLSTRKKILSEPSFFKLLTVDLVQSTEPIFGGLCSHPNERIQTALREEQKTGMKQLPEFIFAVNLVVPGPPFYHLVAYMGTDDVAALKSDKTPWGRIANKFFFGDSDDYRTKTFKLIPRIVDGNFIVKQAVGSKPAILGRKLKQTYIHHERFMELICDIGSNPVASRIVQLAKGYAKSLIVDMMFVLEGKQEAELPERVMGGLRLKNVDFKIRDGQRVVHNP